MTHVETMKRPVLFFLLLAALVAAGCDSNEEEETDLDRMLGTWRLTMISDSNGNRTDAFRTLVSSLTVTLSQQGGNATFSLVVDYTSAAEGAGREDQTLTGTFQLNEAARNLTLVTPTGQLPFTYTIDNDAQVTLRVPALLANAILGPDPPFEGTVTVVIERQ